MQSGEKTQYIWQRSLPKLLDKPADREAKQLIAD